MTGDLYHLTIRVNPDVTREQLEKVLKPAMDWYRYETGLYILHSSTNENVWHQRLEHLVKPKGTLLIYRLDSPRRMGFMPKSFWDWLAKKSPKTSPPS